MKSHFVQVQKCIAASSLLIFVPIVYLPGFWDNAKRRIRLWISCFPQE